MATSCRIGALLGESEVRSILCGREGYPLGAGRVLLASHNSEAAAWKLIASGYQTSLSMPQDWRGHIIDVYQLHQWPTYGTQWAYLWRDGAWQVSEVSHDCRTLGPWQPLADVVARLEAQ